MTLYQCVKCIKLFESWSDVEKVMIDNVSGYYLCDECLLTREIVKQKDLNTQGVSE